MRTRAKSPSNDVEHLARRLEYLVRLHLDPRLCDRVDPAGLAEKAMHPSRGARLESVPPDTTLLRRRLGRCLARALRPLYDDLSRSQYSDVAPPVGWHWETVLEAAYWPDSVRATDSGSGTGPDRPSRRVVRDEAAWDLTAHLHLLTDWHRQVFALWEWQMWTPNEISAVLAKGNFESIGVAYRMARVKLHRARWRCAGPYRYEHTGRDMPWNIGTTIVI